jgi:D-ribulokinase
MRYASINLQVFFFVTMITQAFSLVSPTAQFIGVDLGTSGARLSVLQIDTSQKEPHEVCSTCLSWKEGDAANPTAWVHAVTHLWQEAQMASGVRPQDVAAVCISGTSASCLVVDSSSGSVTRSPRMYNYHVTQSAPDADASRRHGQQALQQLQGFVPAQHTALSATGTLAKLVAWHVESPLQSQERLCHQADYVLMHLLSDASSTAWNTICSDWHNCLKLGYDVQTLQWPMWLTDGLESLGISSSVLPHRVVSPGTPVGCISATVAHPMNLPLTTMLAGGTTDSNAAFCAAAGWNAVPGTAVTSLGSTLALKQVSTTYIEDASRGVYSHRYPRHVRRNQSDSNNHNNSTINSDEDWWLVGGASNVGCAILRQEGFANEELTTLSRRIDPTFNSPLHYYPLTQPGERFPIADSTKQPVLTPRPTSRTDYLHGLLQGIARVECAGYQALAQLGASPAVPHTIGTCGGGARNPTWTTMRQRLLQSTLGDATIQVHTAEHVEASYGAALLAASSFLE